MCHLGIIIKLSKNEPPPLKRLKEKLLCHCAYIKNANKYAKTGIFKKRIKTYSSLQGLTTWKLC